MGDNKLHLCAHGVDFDTDCSECTRRMYVSEKDDRIVTLEASLEASTRHVERVVRERDDATKANEELRSALRVEQSRAVYKDHRTGVEYCRSRHDSRGWHPPGYEPDIPGCVRCQTCTDYERIGKAIAGATSEETSRKIVRQNTLVHEYVLGSETEEHKTLMQHICYADIAVKEKDGRTTMLRQVRPVPVHEEEGSVVWQMFRKPK